MFGRSDCPSTCHYAELYLTLCDFMMKAAAALFLVAFEPMASCAGRGSMPFRQMAKQQIQLISKQASNFEKSIKSSWSAASTSNSSLVLNERGLFSENLAPLTNRELECAVGQCKIDVLALFLQECGVSFRSLQLSPSPFFGSVSYQSRRAPLTSPQSSLSQRILLFGWRSLPGNRMLQSRNRAMWC